MSAPVIYMPNITNFHLAHFIYFDYYFSQSGDKSLYSCYRIENGIDMLPKRSTHVDQTLGSDSIQLSVVLCTFKRPKKVEIRVYPPEG